VHNLEVKRISHHTGKPVKRGRSMKKANTIIGTAVMIIFACCMALMIAGRDIAPPDISDLIPKISAAPVEQNAYTHLIATANSLVLPDDLSVITGHSDEQVENNEMSAIIAKNLPAISLIDKALKFDRCQAPELGNAADLDKFYQIGVLLEARAGHYRRTEQLDRSTKACTSLLRIGDLIHSDARNLSAYGTGITLLQTGLEQARLIAGCTAASLSDLKLLADALAALRPLDQGLTRAVQFQFQTVADAIEKFRSTGLSLEKRISDSDGIPFILRKTTWFPGYLFKENETKQTLAQLYRDTIHNIPFVYADMNLYHPEEYLGLTGSKTSFVLRPNFVGRIFYAFTTPEFSTFLEGKCQMEGSVRATQLVVAIKAFQKTTGVLPDRLSSLCPAYLQTVPLDPFDGLPFRYSRSKEIIYSVGKDLLDSGGSTEIPPGEIYGRDYPKTWIAEDAVFQIE